MSVIGRGWNRIRAAAASFGSTLSAPQQWFVNFMTGNSNPDGGPVVNEFTALNYLAVYQCVSLIAATIARLPLVTYRSIDEGCEHAKDRSEYRLLMTEFNPRMSAMTGRECGNAHLLTWGGSFTQIVRNTARTKVLQLNPLGPDVVRIRVEGEKTVYDVYQRGTNQLLATVPAEDMLHVVGLSFDGLAGYSQIRIAKDAIRGGLAQDQESMRFITRGIRPPGAVKSPAGKKFKDKQHAQRWRAEFNEIHATQNSSQNVVVLEDGADWQDLGVDPKNAQLLESRRFSKLEICGLYRTPPHLVGVVDVATSWGTGLAEMAQGWVDYCLLDWMTRIEQEYNRKLFVDDPDVYCRHSVDELLRGRLLDRTQARQIQHMRGIITDNEWRRSEHLNTVEGGDIRHFPLAEGRIDLDGETLPMPEGAAGATPPAIPEPPVPGEPKPDAPPKKSPNPDNDPLEAEE